MLHLLLLLLLLLLPWRTLGFNNRQQSEQLKIATTLGGSGSIDHCSSNKRGYSMASKHKQVVSVGRVLVAVAAAPAATPSWCKQS